MKTELLQAWANANHSDDTTLIYKQGFWDQITFIRDYIYGGLIWKNKLYDYKDLTCYISVISTHVSKSVLLPVYYIKLDCGMEITLRYNFYDWKVSINSPFNIDIDFGDLTTYNHQDQRWTPILCEGFPENMVYGTQQNNKKQFTVEIGDNYKLFTFLWIIVKKYLL